MTDRHSKNYAYGGGRGHRNPTSISLSSRLSVMTDGHSKSSRGRGHHNPTSVCASSRAHVTTGRNSGNSTGNNMQREVQKLASSAGSIKVKRSQVEIWKVSGNSPQCSGRDKLSVTSQCNGKGKLSTTITQVPQRTSNRANNQVKIEHKVIKTETIYLKK